MVSVDKPRVQVLLYHSSSLKLGFKCDIFITVLYDTQMRSNGLYKRVLSVCAMEAWDGGTHAGDAASSLLSLPACVCVRWRLGTEAWDACSHAAGKRYTVVSDPGARVSSWKIELRNLKRKRGNSQREGARRNTYHGTVAHIGVCFSRTGKA